MLCICYYYYYYYYYAGLWAASGGVQMGLEVSASVRGVYELGILSRRDSYPTFKFTINNPPPVPSPPPCIPSQLFSFIALVLLGKEDGGLPIARWGHDDVVTAVACSRPQSGQLRPLFSAVLPTILSAISPSPAAATVGVGIPGALSPLFTPAPEPGDARCLQDLIPPPPPISGFGVLGALGNGSLGGSVSI